MGRSGGGEVGEIGAPPSVLSSSKALIDTNGPCVRVVRRVRVRACVCPRPSPQRAHVLLLPLGNPRLIFCHASLPPYTDEHARASTHTRTHAHTYVHTHTHVHTYTHVLSRCVNEEVPEQEKHTATETETESES